MKNNKHQFLVNRCKRNDKKAQMMVYDLYAQAMFQTAFNFCKDDMVAQDIMQEAFLKAFKKIDSYNGTASLGAWLKRIVVNQSLDWLKKAKIETVTLEDHVYHLAIEEEVKLENDQSTVELLYATIDQLPTKCRQVTKLYLVEGYSHDEIAQILDITEIASRSLLSRGKARLKQLLTKQVS